jgi:hypothetical protein
MPTCAHVRSMCARRRFRHAQTAMEMGEAMSSPGGANSWRRSSVAVGRAREAEAGEVNL